MGRWATDPRRAELVALVESAAGERASPPLLLPATPYIDLAGEEFGRQLLLTTAGDGADYCLRPDFTLPIVSAYFDAGRATTPASYAYMGAVFRQIEGQVVEDEQAGLELLGQIDGAGALARVLSFAGAALALFGIGTPKIRVGDVALFEALLAALPISPPWRARLRQRFGHPEAMERLLARLAAAAAPRPPPPLRTQLMDDVADMLAAAGIGSTAARGPEEIVERYLEQAALAAKPVPAGVVAVLRDYLSIDGAPGDALEQLERLAAAAGLDLAVALAATRDHLERLAWLLPEAEVSFAAGFAPRLDYYTGFVFDMRGATDTILASGGEYDRLLVRLGATAPVAASGCAVWTSRLAEGAP